MFESSPSVMDSQYSGVTPYNVTLSNSTMDKGQGFGSSINSWMANPDNQNLLMTLGTSLMASGGDASKLGTALMHGMNQYNNNLLQKQHMGLYERAQNMSEQKYKTDRDLAEKNFTENQLNNAFNRDYHNRTLGLQSNEFEERKRQNAFQNQLATNADQRAGVQLGLSQNADQRAAAELGLRGLEYQRNVGNDALINQGRSLANQNAQLQITKEQQAEALRPYLGTFMKAAEAGQLTQFEQQYPGKAEELLSAYPDLKSVYGTRIPVTLNGVPVNLTTQQYLQNSQPRLVPNEDGTGYHYQNMIPGQTMAAPPPKGQDDMKKALLEWATGGTGSKGGTATSKKTETVPNPTGNTGQPNVKSQMDQAYQRALQYYKGDQNAAKKAIHDNLVGLYGMSDQQAAQLGY